MEVRCHESADRNGQRNDVHHRAVPKVWFSRLPRLRSPRECGVSPSIESEQIGNLNCPAVILPHKADRPQTILKAEFLSDCVETTLRIRIVVMAGFQDER